MEDYHLATMDPYLQYQDLDQARPPYNHPPSDTMD